MVGNDERTAPGVVGRKSKPTLKDLEARIRLLDWQVDILSKAVLALQMEVQGADG